MTKLKNPLLGLKAHDSLANTLTFQDRGNKMNLTKAREILKLQVNHIFTTDSHDFEQALKLSIKALDLIILIRNLLPPPEALILPGETEE